ncbi:MAG TPA: hypothetical protein VFD92_10265 [Candidatus Binatia bacterium]|nr:hypothetical protein [Candidatus Binatia bacterium]
MRRTVTMLALALAFAIPATGRALAAESTTTMTQTTTTPSGRLVITDAKTRSFRVGSDTHVYVAPDDVDLSSLSGHDVKVFVGNDGRVSRVTRSETVETHD